MRLGVVNLSGNLHLRAGRVAFLEIDNVLAELEGKVDHILVDMHAELTSEKIAMGWYLDGRVTAVVGTHTHVPTADLRVLPGGTAYITDVGMTGPRGGVLGVKKEQSIESMRTHMNGALRDQRGRPLADGRRHPLRGAAAACSGDRASARAVATSAASSSAFLTPTATTAQACW